MRRSTIALTAGFFVTWGLGIWLGIWVRTSWYALFTGAACGFGAPLGIRAADAFIAKRKG